MPGGAPVGNQNARKNKPWESAIKRALARRASGDSEAALNNLADKFLDAVQNGDLSAFKELGDRLDGKPKQQIETTGPDDGPIEQKLTVEFVNAGADPKGA